MAGGSAEPIAPCQRRSPDQQKSKKDREIRSCSGQTSSWACIWELFWEELRVDLLLVLWRALACVALRQSHTRRTIVLNTPNALTSCLIMNGPSPFCSATEFATCAAAASSKPADPRYHGPAWPTPVAIFALAGGGGAHFGDSATRQCPRRW
jgi:hypothetical protein